jgi:hypothetical protein
MLSRPQTMRRRPIPCAVVLCAGLLVSVMLPGAAHAAHAGSHSRIISQIIGGSRDDHGFTVGAESHSQTIGGSRDDHGATVAPRTRNAG